MISLGLRRINELVQRLGNPIAGLKVFHVAGTNGKGSVCTYLESVLSSRMQVGKFTSPHLATPNDAIQINQKALSLQEYTSLTRSTTELSQASGIHATEFEIQTAVAFQAFRIHGLQAAIIEVGLGGLEDATNVLEPQNVLCSAITKVAIDHEAFLGTTLASVAKHKAGIIKHGVPCVVDGSNPKEVLDVVAGRAQEVGTSLHITASDPANFVEANKAVAAAALEITFPNLARTEIESGIEAARWPGRLQWINDHTVLDGAHNVSAALELRDIIKPFRPLPVRWVVAFSKPPEPLLNLLVEDGDHVVATEFPAVDGMPWVKSQPSASVAQAALQRTHNVSVLPSIEHLVDDFKGITVICGSLYLVGHYLRHQKLHES